MQMAATAKKIVKIGDSINEKIIDSKEYKRELGVFAEIDINRPAWIDKYIVDSTIDGQSE